MKCSDFYSVFLSYSLVCNVSCGAVTVRTGGSLHLIHFNQSKADYLLPWVKLKNAMKLQVLLNSQGSRVSAVYGVHHFPIVSNQQIKVRVPRFSVLHHGLRRVAPYPQKFDWRERGAVGPVHNQRSCGGCWAFSVVSAVESVQVKDGGTFQELSVQQVIDCAYYSKGCDGGSPVSALEWLKQSGEKLVMETEYPYKEKTGLCQVFPQSHGGVSVKDYAVFNFRGQEGEMSKSLVDLGPLVVIVDALSWQDYQGGIIQHHCSAEHANHAVLITGYDTTGEVPFWIVRNSWGTSWGDEGYAYIKMGENLCGVANSVAAVFL